MARIRTIKPEFWDSPSTARASAVARLAYIGMWNWADDHGRGTANLKELEGFLFPNDDIPTLSGGTSENFRHVMQEVAECFGVMFYTSGGRKYYAIPSWESHQRTERSAKPKHPGPNDPDSAPDLDFGGTSENFRDTAAELPRSSGPGTGEQGNRGTGEQGNSDPPNPPRGKRGSRLAADWMPQPETVEKIAAECPGLDYRSEHAVFIDYWIAQPGQKGVKLDWDATWRNWMRRKHSEIQTRRKPTPSERAAQTMQLGPRLATELDLKEIA